MKVYTPHVCDLLIADAKDAYVFRGYAREYVIHELFTNV